MTTLSNDSSKIKALLDKLKALAERGEKHERNTARLKMNALMRKHGFSSGDSNYRTFKVSDWADHKNLLLQCILDTKPNAKMEGNKVSKKIHVTLNDYEFIEVLEKWDFYWKELLQQKKALFIAFVVKHNIGTNVNHNYPSAVKSFDMESVVKITGVLKNNKYKSRHQKAIGCEI